ncbi:MAG: ornithine carbamoyltransferase, partial [Pseudomonadota bacterium]|nr:ornithine carbamoyltransferase [Pseudomonadota bacterium]
MVARHFLTLGDLSPAELDGLLRRGIGQKSRKVSGPRPLSGRVLAMVFEKSSTRTRVSFE